MGVRSLFAGVSGLRNFQQQLDIIGNNIANSQTAGYKATRITFQDLLSQTVKGATASSNSLGGTNPQQFGLGSSIGAIDTDYSQGNLMTTGRKLDLAISGNGFFKVSDGGDTYYTRNGAFDIDEEGFLVSTTSGYKVQGYNANAGVLDQTAVGDIQIPVGIILPAQPTTTVGLVGNLNATEEQIGSVHETEALLADELPATTNDMDGLFAIGNLNSRIAGLQPDVSTITIDGTILTYVNNDLSSSNGNFNSLTDLIQEMSNAVASTFAIDANGAIAQTVGAGTHTISSNNSSLNSSLSSLSGAGLAGTSDAFAHTAIETDLLTNLRNSTGTNLGLTAGADTITVDGSVGGTAITQGTLSVVAGSTLGNLADSIATSLKITNSDNNVEVINGKIRITGDGGSDYSISDIDIASGDPMFDAVFDDSTGNWSKIRSATDNHVTSFISYDSDGVQHTLTIKYNVRDSSSAQGTWVFNVHSLETSSGTSETVTPATSPTGTVTFGPDGALSSFSPAQITIYPNSGVASPIEVTFDPGTVDDFNGLVSFENESSARFTDLTGYASGELQDVSLNSVGEITGNFTNGQNQILSQLTLAMFDNPSGLEKVGGNSYVASLNSGVATDSTPTVAGRGALIPSALEGSNVDLAREFVNLITAQRAFQSNSKIISAANDIMGILVGLVR